MRRVLDILNRLPVFARTSIQVLAFCLGRLATRPSRIMGIEILQFTDVQEDVADKFGRALSLIERCEPRWLKHIREKVRRIVIVPIGVPSFRARVRGCYLPLWFVRAADEEELAVTLVHEATHARLHDWGCRARENEIQFIGRIEGVCVAREVAFARKIPVRGERLAREAQERLAKRYWEPEQRKAWMADVLDEVDEIRHRGTTHSPPREKR